MLCDLNISWSSAASTAELQRTLTFLSELNYTTVALNHVISPPLPSVLTNPIPTSFPFAVPPNLNVLRRGTIIISDPTQNHRLPLLAPQYDILAIRPTTEKAFQAACTTMSNAEFSIISLDLSIRYQFHFKPKPLMAAVNRGIKFELCYSQAMGGSSGSRATVLSNIISIIRATQGRGLIVSSEAKSVLGVRPMEDVRNLLVVWGLSGDRAGECLTVNPRSVVKNEAIRRTGYRGIVDVVENGAVPGQVNQAIAGKQQKKAGQPKKANPPSAKRKGMSGDEIVDVNGVPKTPKGQAKKMRN